MAAVKTTQPGEPGADALPVRAGEEPWSPDELASVRTELENDIARIAEELQVSESDLDSLMRDYGGGSGDDSADTGGKVLEREQGLTLTQNSRMLLEQNKRALERIEGISNIALVPKTGPKLHRAA